MLCYYHLDPKEQTSIKFRSQYKTFHSWKCIWKYRLRNGNHSVRGDELSEMRETHKCNCVLPIVWRQGCDAAVPWDLYVIYMANAHKAFIVLPQTSSNTDTLHYDVIIGTMASQITSLMICLLKENIKAPRHWPLCGEITGDRWIPRTNGQSRGKCFHLMTSSCHNS